MCRVFLFLTLILAACTAHGQDTGKKPVLPHTGAVNIIDPELYTHSTDYDDIFTPATWKEVNGVYMRLRTSSGMQGYIELEFLNGTDYIMQRGFRTSISDSDQGKEHCEVAGTWMFDSGKALLTLGNKKGDEVYTVDYFTTSETSGIRYMEILTLTYTGETQFGRTPTITFIR